MPNFIKLIRGIVVEVELDNSKEMYIHTNIADMSDSLSIEQLHALEYTLRKNLKGKNIVNECTDLSTWVDDNEYIIKLFLTSKRIEGCKKSTLTQYKLTIKNFFLVVQKNYKGVRKDDIKMYLALRMKKVKQTTLLNTKRNLSSFFSWLNNEGYIDRNPVPKGGIRIDEVENVYLTIDEEVKVRDVEKNIKEQALIDFLFSTGVRVGELISLNKTDVNFSAGTVTFRSEKGTRKYRTVILDARAKQHLMDYLNTRNDGNIALFVTDRKYKGEHKRLCLAAVENITKSVGKRANIDKNLTVHVFRRTLATRLADQKCPLEVIQEILGHAKVETTQRYIARNHNRIIRDASVYFSKAV